MNTSIEHPLARYFRDKINYKNCPGCGNGIIAHAVLRAIDRLGGNIDDYAFVSGIGCSGWIPSPFFNTDVLHVTHGRPIAVATGLKLAIPDKRVVVIAGDGDTSAIGGNHFIHAARRNIDITLITVNNSIYGMTGGQAAPTTPYSSVTTTTPYGNIERQFDLCELMKAAGATFIARWTTYHARQLEKSLITAFEHSGFSFVEVISQCPVQYGKVIGQRNDAVGMMISYKENSISLEASKAKQKEELAGKIIIGEFIRETGVPEFSSEMERLRREVLSK
jgi:2-oxoglutarate ferredoxin oxidoreductase subunit beta